MLRAVDSQALLQRPKRRAHLALLQVVEGLAALEDARELNLTTLLLLDGVLPHLTTSYARSVRQVFRGLEVMTDLLEARDVPGAGSTSVEPQVLHEAVTAIGSAIAVSGLLNALDQAAAGWRSFEFEGDTVRLMYKLPDYMLRAVELNIVGEAEHNAPYVEASTNSEEDRAFHRRLEAIRTGVLDVNPRTDPETLDRATAYAGRAGEVLHRWSMPTDLTVSHQGRTLFTVADYRAAAEAIHGLATITTLLAEGRATLGASRILHGPREAWTSFIRDRAQIGSEQAAHVLNQMTWTAASRGHSPTFTPFVEIADDVLGLSTTCALWQNPQTALRATWAARFPADYGKKVAELGHQLSTDAGAYLGNLHWKVVTRREVPGVGDIDCGTGEDGFFLTFEAKVFSNDDNTRAEDRKYWGELAKVVVALRDGSTFSRVLGDMRIVHKEVRGALLVPGRMNPALSVGPDYSLLGFEDLKEFASESSGPRELWDRIKAAETRATLPRRVYTQVHDGLTFEVDGADIDAIPGAVRVDRPSG